MKIKVETDSKAFAGGGFLAFRQADHLLNHEMCRLIDEQCPSRGVPISKRVELLLGQVIHGFKSTRGAWENAKNTNAVAFVNQKMSKQNVRNFYRSIEDLGAANSEELYEKIASIALQKTGISIAIVHADTTSQYFTGKKAARAKKGYSRDHRPDELQINVGIIQVKNTHIISAYIVAPGNQHDTAIFVKLVYSTKLGALIVGDRGVASKENKAFVIESGRHYLFGEKLYGPVKREALAALPLMKRVREGYFVYSIKTGCEWRHYFLSEKLREDVRETRKRHARTTASEYAENLSKKKRGSKVKRFTRITAEGEEVIVQREIITRRLFSKTPDQILAELSKDDPLDGVFVLSSDLVSDAAQALAEYKCKDEVEKVFCALKGSLHLRPFHARKQACVDGVIFITMLALLVVSLLAFCSRATGVAVKTLVEELRRVTLLVVISAKKQIQRVSCLNLDGWAKKLLGSMNFNAV